MSIKLNELAIVPGAKPATRGQSHLIPSIPSHLVTWKLVSFHPLYPRTCHQSHLNHLAVQTLNLYPITEGGLQYLCWHSLFLSWLVAVVPFHMLDLSHSRYSVKYLARQRPVERVAFQMKRCVQQREGKRAIERLAPGV